MNILDATITDLGDIKYLKSGLPYMEAKVHCYGNDQKIHIIRNTEEELKSIKIGDVIKV